VTVTSPGPEEVKKKENKPAGQAKGSCRFSLLFPSL
jgi:hypothetical protein